MAAWHWTLLGAGGGWKAGGDDGPPAAHSLRSQQNHRGGEESGLEGDHSLLCLPLTLPAPAACLSVGLALTPRTQGSHPQPATPQEQRSFLDSQQKHA